MKLMKPGRPEKLGGLTQEEVRAKTKELGTIRKTAEFYQCSIVTIKRKIGDFQYKGIMPEDIEDIKRMATTHTKKRIGELLGYTYDQIECAGKKHGISFAGRKPRSDSRLTHYEMNNMDLIVKQYPTAQDCADDHDVCVKNIQDHVYKCRKHRASQAAK